MFFISCEEKENTYCNSFEDMYATLPQKINYDTLTLKGKIACNYRIKYVLTNKDESADLIVSMFDEHINVRLQEYFKKLPEIAKKNEIPEEELINGLRYKTRTFCKGVRSVVASCEKKEEFTSFEKTPLYKAGFTINRLDVLIKNRYCLSIYLHSAKKMKHNEFKKFIQPYLEKFNFNELQ